MNVTRTAGEDFRDVVSFERFQALGWVTFQRLVHLASYKSTQLMQTCPRTLVMREVQINI